MASDSKHAPAGSGQDIIEPVFEPPRDESNDDTAAAEPFPPPTPLPDEDPQGRIHERPGEGGGSPDPAAAAEAADRKGKKVAAASPSPSPSPSSSESSSRRISRRSITEAVDSGRGVKVSWKEPVVEGVMAVPKIVRPIDLKNVFDRILQEQKTQRDLERREAVATGGKKKRKKGRVKPPRPRLKGKKPIGRKVKDGMNKMVLKRIRRHMLHSNRNSTLTQPHVYHSIISTAAIIQHYELLIGQGTIMNSNELLLRRAYSGFRPVLGDGECFYRSFIFSYLEQVLDRQDTHEEHRLLDVVKEVARQHACLGWTSKFSNRRKAFKKLIKKVMRWKRHSRWLPVPTTNRYRREKLLEFFRGYDTTKCIFAFLRLVAAIWICSHREEYEPLVSDLREGYTLRDWCFREVIPARIDADHVQMVALVNALRVPLRVENLFGGIGQDLYTGQDAEDDVPRSTCCQRRRSHMLPPDHEVPRVSVLFSNGHYDIIYPHRRDGSLPSTDEGCSQGTGPGPGEGSVDTGGSSSRQ